MTPELRLFLLELADLLEKHGVSLTAGDTGADYYPAPDGVEFFISGQWDDTTKIQVRESCYAHLRCGTMDITDRELRIFANNS